jgi:hypothetical protein
LAVAETEGLDVFAATDKNLRYEQDLSGRRVVVVMDAQWPRLEPYVDRRCAGRRDGHVAGDARESGLVIAVTSHMAYANTASLARQIEDAFATETRYRAGSVSPGFRQGR